VFELEMSHDLVKDQTTEAIVGMLRAARAAAEKVTRTMQSLPVWRQLVRDWHKTITSRFRLGSRDTEHSTPQLDIRLADVDVFTGAAAAVYQYEDVTYLVRHRVKLPP